MAVSIFRALLAGMVLVGLAGCATDGVTRVGDEVPRGDLVLRASGPGDWRVDCAVETERGRTAQAEIDGIGSRNSDLIVVDGAISGRCDYAAGDAPFALTSEDDSVACPFEAAADGFCRLGVPAGQTGSFAVTPQ